MNAGRNARRGRGMMGPGGRGAAEKPNDFKGTWKKLLIYCKRYLFIMAISLLCAVIGTVFTLIGPDKLSELTDTITEGLAPDTTQLAAVSETILKNMAQNTATLIAHINENFSDTETLSRNAAALAADNRLSAEDRAALRVTMESLQTYGNTDSLRPALLSLPTSIQERLLDSITINGSTLTSADQFAVFASLAQSGQTPSTDQYTEADTPDEAEGTTSPTDTGTTTFSTSFQTVLQSWPPSAVQALYNDITFNGQVIPAADQQQFLSLLQNLQRSQETEHTDQKDTLAQLRQIPASISPLLNKSIDMDKVLSVALFLAAIYVLSYLLSSAQGFLMATVTQRVSKRLRSDLSRKINRLPMWYYHKTTTGDILSRVTNDVDTIGQSLNQSIGTLLTAVVLLLGSLFMMFKTNVILSLTAIGASLIGFIFMFVVMGKSQKYFARQQQHLGQINGHVEEIFAGHTVVKAYNGEANAQTAFDKMNDDLRSSSFRAQCLSGLMMPMMNFIGNFGYVAVCIVGGLLALDGQIGFGTIVAFMIYVRYFTSPLSQIAQAMQSLQSAAAAGERVFAFLEAEEMEDESSKTAALSHSKGSVSFSHVKFGYEGTDRTVIHDFSVKVKPGQKIAIVGPTGAGKTTLVNLLMRFHEIQDGTITIDGISTKELTRETVHAQFCMVLQDTWLFEGTLRENLVYCSENVSDDQLKQACKAVGLYHFIKTLPNGFDTVLNDNVSLSQGQKQQLTIARAMIADKPMLILDEATSSVDTRTELKIQAAMDKLMENRTSFVIAHRLSTIRNADLILVLKDGDVIESGTHTALLEKGGFYADLYNSQFLTTAAT